MHICMHQVSTTAMTLYLQLHAYQMLIWLVSTLAMQSTCIDKFNYSTHPSGLVGLMTMVYNLVFGVRVDLDLNMD